MEQRDVIFKGATRPAMMLGVPIVPLILVVGIHLLLAVWSMTLISVFAMFVILMACGLNVFFMRQISTQDDQRLNQHLLRLKSIAGRRNSAYWGAHSMSPLDYSKRR
ncbi:VirB3 family type IV secretion system protein [Noviherbaspirillum sp.]|jgi:type IV secretion system protein VirB3|uniref:type IV secretion system protein VirB3 n=1 Tax=Noviherbaspirillum sp. TaxID=1926288 RepID=UPI0025D69FAE|nr:VirB3 family type IV secretion system protein [Noviherbaspirillum sp.]